MVSKVIKAVGCCMCLSILINLCGCSAQKDVTKESEDVSFARMTQDEKQIYVINYLEDQYGIKTTVSDIEKRQINSFSSEDNYYAIAKYNDTERIYCWITDEGIVYDSEFVNDLSDDINSLFETKIGNRLYDYKVVCKSTLNSPTTLTWNKETVEEMLNKEDISTSVRIFVNKNEKDKALKLVDNKFENMFSFATGTCYIYFVDDTKSIDFSINELSAFDAKFEFIKE